MKSFPFGLCFLMLLFVETTAQNNLPPAYELKSDTGVYVPIDEKYWQMLEDHEGKWTAELVKQPPISNNFHANDTNVNGVDYRIHFYWLRYRLKNTMSRTVEIVLLNIAQADQTDFYLFDEENASFHYTTGILYPNKKKMA